MPYFSGPTQWAANPGPKGRGYYGNPNPGFTGTDPTSPVDLGKIQETERDPGAEMSYDVGQPGHEPQDLVRSLVPTKVQPVLPEEVQKEDGTRWPWHEKPRKEGPKPKPYPYTIYPGTTVQDIEDHPDFRDPNRYMSPNRLPGREAALAVEAVAGRGGIDPNASIDYMRGFLRGWVAAAHGEDIEKLQFFGETSAPIDFLVGLSAGRHDGQLGIEERYDAYRTKVREYLLSRTAAVTEDPGYMRAYVSGWSYGRTGKPKIDTSLMPVEISEGFARGYEDGAAGKADTYRAYQEKLSPKKDTPKETPAEAPQAAPEPAEAPKVEALAPGAAEPAAAPPPAGSKPIGELGYMRWYLSGWKAGAEKTWVTPPEEIYGHGVQPDAEQAFYAGLRDAVEGDDRILRSYEERLESEGFDIKKAPKVKPEPKPEPEAVEDEPHPWEPEKPPAPPEPAAPKRPVTIWDLLNAEVPGTEWRPPGAPKPRYLRRLWEDIKSGFKEGWERGKHPKSTLHGVRGFSTLANQEVPIVDEIIGVKPEQDWTLTRAQVANFSVPCAWRMAKVGITHVSRDMFIERLAKAEGKTYFDVSVQFPGNVVTDDDASKLVDEAKSAAKKAGFSILDADPIPERFRELRIFIISVDGACAIASDAEVAINTALAERGSPAVVRVVRIPRKPFMSLPFIRPVLDPSRPGAVDEKGEPVELAQRDDLDKSIAPTKEKGQTASGQPKTAKVARQKVPAWGRTASPKQKAEPMIASWDEYEEAQAQIEYIKQNPQEYDYIWHGEIPKDMNDPKVEDQISKYVYEDSDLWGILYDEFTSRMNEILAEKGEASGNYWDVEGRNLGWRHQSGSVSMEKISTWEDLQKFLPKTSQMTIHVYDAGPGFRMMVYHHDAPTGESYDFQPIQILPAGTRVRVKSSGQKGTITEWVEDSSGDLVYEIDYDAGGHDNFPPEDLDVIKEKRPSKTTKGALPIL